MVRSLSRWFGTKAPRAKVAASHEVKPVIEALEDRAVPSVTVSNGTIRINQTDGNDRATVRFVFDGEPLPAYPFHIKYIEVKDNGKVTQVYLSQMQWPDLYHFTGRIIYQGYGGNDYFRNDTFLPTTAWGGDGNNTLIGGSGPDVLIGGDGNDKLYGNLGNDYLLGGRGNDQLFGAAGEDWLLGGLGNDYLDGNGPRDDSGPYPTPATDPPNGGYGSFMDGQPDHLFGGAGADRFVAEWRDGGFNRLFPYTNLDAPQDFSARQGDSIVNPPLGSIFNPNLPVVVSAKL
jgi:Ca2+-binding RTX toxin-like protein